MKSNEELLNLYDTEIKPQLKDIESKRKKVKRIWGSAIACIATLFILKNFLVQGIVLIAIICILGAITFAIWGVIQYTDYRKIFKKEVVTKIIHLVNPDYKYNANRYINSSIYYESKIFNQRHDRYKGDDYISGKIGKTDFEFSELKTEYKTESRDSDGNSSTKWHTIFQGLFFHADFNKNIEGTTFVLPDMAEKLFGKFGQKLQKASSRGDLVKLENPEFEKEFVVYSTSQQEARYILTPTMMEAMVNIKKQFKRKMHFSFTGSRVYCAVSFSKGLFEPRVRKSGINYGDIEEMYSLFRLIEIIVNEMNLNTRIWTKN